MMAEADKIPELLPPAVYFPYPKMGQSASGIACDVSGGKFGVFDRQMFVGDQSSSFLMRISLEKVDDFRWMSMRPREVRVARRRSVQRAVSLS